MKQVLIIATCLLLAFSSWCSAGENRFQKFNADVDAAYAAYRKALFQTNMKDANKSAKANSSFQGQWKQILKTYRTSPPETFKSDPKWSETLVNIERIAGRGSELIKDGKLAEAHEHLEGIRDELSDLRQRNSVIVFSDHINNYHEVMERLLSAGYSPDRIDDSAVDTIRGQLSVLTYLAESIRDNSPVRYNDNEQFQQLRDNLFSSLDALEKALAGKDPEEISRSIKMLKPAYAKLFVNFG